MLDRETRDRYDLTVLASDNGTPSSTATTRVIVNVMDANDNDPKFQKASYEFSVEENLRRGSVVGVIQAKDADLDINAAIRYSLIPSNSSFQINPVSGECVVKLFSLPRTSQMLVPFFRVVLSRASIPALAIIWMLLCLVPDLSVHKLGI